MGEQGSYFLIMGLQGKKIFISMELGIEKILIEKIFLGVSHKDLLKKMG